MQYEIKDQPPLIEQLLSEIKIADPVHSLPPGADLDPNRGSSEYVPLLLSQPWQDASPDELYAMKKGQGFFREAVVNFPGTAVYETLEYGRQIHAVAGNPQKTRTFGYCTPYSVMPETELDFLEGIKTRPGTVYTMHIPTGGDLLYFDKNRKAVDTHIPPAFPWWIEAQMTKTAVGAIFGPKPARAAHHMFDDFAAPGDLAVCAFYLPGTFSDSRGQMIPSFANTAFTHAGFRGRNGRYWNSKGTEIDVRLFSRISQRNQYGWGEVIDPEFQLNEKLMNVWVQATQESAKYINPDMPLTNTESLIVKQMKELGRLP